MLVFSFCLQTRSLFEMKLCRRNSSLCVHKLKHNGRKRGVHGRDANGRNITKIANGADGQGV